jgi:DNA-directed RNA polymerase subunit RPC12/RpoP
MTATEEEALRCPRCGSACRASERRVPRTYGVYDVMTDSYGLMKCANCGHRAAAGWFLPKKESK